MFFQTIGKTLIFLGLVLVLVGALILWGPKIPFWDKIPGNLRWQKGPVTVYFPLGICVVVSLVLSLILYLVGRK